MKLQQFTISATELQDYLDKYEDKVKFILFFPLYIEAMSVNVNNLILIIDVE